MELVDDRSRLTEREQFYIDNTRPHYNILRKARSGLGFKHSEEERLRIAERMRQRYASMTLEERRAAVLASGFSMTGARHSNETKARMSVSQKAVKRSGPPSNMAAAHTPEAIAKRAAKKAKTYIVTSPDGNEVEITNMTRFCKEKNLSQAHMTSVATGRRKHHKEWKCRAV